MKKLKDILKNVAILSLSDGTSEWVKDIIFDSRKISEGSLFVAQKGVSFDGHAFIEKAIELGAVVIVCQELPSVLKEEIAYVQVVDSDLALALMASNYYDNPSSKLKLVGVTGTNGKTTVATLLYDLFQKSGLKSGLLSTVKIKVGTNDFPATHTTPDSVTINSYLAKMLAEDVTHCFMEVSSHGIHQKRTEGLDFDGGVFTNLTHDHLDYHKTFAEYRDVKKLFFDSLSKEAFALVNSDDKNGRIMLQNTKAKKVTYALKTMADYKARILEKGLSGMLLNINSQEVWCRLIGDFNAYNLLAIFGVAELLGMESNEALLLMSQLESVNGRFEYKISSEGIVTIVDYAHTPDAIKNVLETIEGVRTGKEKVITVMGCGGDRDKVKRSKMGQVASTLSDQVIFTSDNPRFEDPQSIIDQIESGVSKEHLKKTLSILDRKQAIKTACRMAESGDILLVAGKGHETYQDTKGVKTHFDDKEVLEEVLKELEK
ncbi:UDP-N-acetylmuramoyl-L-alanyl-D-glutamate--2,6-diaminopimelate ligase [Flavicella sediminum]|uniref:UDP-N-acetylmuramoyl-L-alanyl-D-glutamate--2, 6-diaminopimelate ligase n=1 Tax=Flavicella sediminum TaxID=2585141 RepID=UPI00112370A5|nr:UDP-N-acetylmuramoyl-L-alanyl-D-glutamate--2,6-diaminopimelate ligase [Flavicella sediminum]